MTSIHPTPLVLMAVACALPFAASCRDSPPHGTAAAPDTATWSLAPRARWRIGAGADAPAYTFDRVYSGLISGDGTALVGNSGTSQVRFFDRVGTYLSGTGREGAGPGEFRSINWMSRSRGDSILVFDLRSQRFSVLDAHGAFVRAFQNPASGGPARPLGRFSDGSILVSVEKSYDPRVQTGRVRDAMALYRVAADGSRADSVARLDGSEWLLYGDGMRYRATRLPFGHSELAVVAGDRVIHGATDSTRLHVLDRSGRELATVELPLRPRRLSEREVAESLEEAVTDSREREIVRRELRRSGDAGAPVFDDLRVDSEGNVWVRAYPRARAAEAKWLVLDPAGRTLGSLLMPVSWTPLHIHGALLLIRERDADGAEQVSLREMVR